MTHESERRMPIKLQIPGDLLRTYYGLGISVMMGIQQGIKQIRLHSNRGSKKTQKIQPQIHKQESIR